MRRKCNINDRKTTDYDNQIPKGKGVGAVERRSAMGIAQRTPTKRAPEMTTAALERCRRVDE
jgi:hypothetical protein